jgi:hypothetical protein
MTNEGPSSDNKEPSKHEARGFRRGRRAEREQQGMRAGKKGKQGAPTHVPVIYVTNHVILSFRGALEALSSLYLRSSDQENDYRNIRTVR